MAKFHIIIEESKKHRTGIIIEAQSKKEAIDRFKNYNIIKIFLIKEYVGHTSALELPIKEMEK